MKTEKRNEKKADISLEAVVSAAIGLLNREGIQKLTMRALAGELGIKAASLYWHIKDKQQLYEQIAEHISKGIQPSCGLGDPKAYLMEGARLYRQKMREVRDSPEVFMIASPVTPCRLELIKNMLISLLHLGIKEKYCMIAGHMFNNYILCFVADEPRLQAGLQGVPNPFSPILGTGYEQLSADEQFALGLNALFAGFKIFE
jgi:AcrR family transcriptional regulator